MRNIQWKIYYDDGSTFDNTDGDANDAPPYGVICVVQKDDEIGRMLLHRWDYYALHDDEWYGHHLDGLLFEFSNHAKGIHAVKVGRTIGNEPYQDILKTATADPDFPVKSAKRVGEAGNDKIK